MYLYPYIYIHISITKTTKPHQYFINQNRLHIFKIILPTYLPTPLSHEQTFKIQKFIIQVSILITYIYLLQKNTHKEHIIHPSSSIIIKYLRSSVCITPKVNPKSIHNSRIMLFNSTAHMFPPPKKGDLYVLIFTKSYQISNRLLKTSVSY